MVQRYRKKWLDKSSGFYVMVLFNLPQIMASFL